MKMFIGRLSEILLAVLGLLIFLPTMAAVALLVWQGSPPGPLFSRRTRYSPMGRPVDILVFRTDYLAGGRALRQTRLDELPRIIQLLTGEISIFGPSTERHQFVEQLEIENKTKRTISLSFPKGLIVILPPRYREEFLGDITELCHNWNEEGRSKLYIYWWQFIHGLTIVWVSFRFKWNEYFGLSRERETRK